MTEYYYKDTEPPSLPCLLALNAAATFHFVRNVTSFEIFMDARDNHLLARSNAMPTDYQLQHDHEKHLSALSAVATVAS
jgi:hypothetical protein